jgi:hypothetical protein
MHGLPADSFCSVRNQLRHTASDAVSLVRFLFFPLEKTQAFSETA